MEHRTKYWVGPTLVNELAERFEAAGLKVVCRGTEHIYIDAEGHTPEGARHDALVDLERHHGTSFGLR